MIKVKQSDLDGDVQNNEIVFNLSFCWNSDLSGIRLSQIMRYLCGVAYVLENLNVDGRQKPIQGAKSTMPWSRKSKSQNDGRKWPKKRFHAYY